MRQDRSLPTVDIGVITIREDEFRAVLDAFAGDEQFVEGSREYTLRRIALGDGTSYLVGIVRLIEQGNGEALDAARDMIEDLDPQLLMVVGIAGGVPSDDFTLGDVVVSTRVNEYCVEQRKWREKPTYSLGGGPIDKALSARIANLPARERDLGDWTSGLPERPSVKWKGKKGLVYGPKKWADDVAAKLEAHFGRKATPRLPTFVAGQIAASDRLIKDPTVLLPWKATSRHLLAVEMESGGVYRAARSRCAMVAIRGISDIIGLVRDEKWTHYACAAAARFARGFLQTRPVKTRATGVNDDIPPASSADGSPIAVVEQVHTNLVQLVRYPETIFVAPATVSSMKEGWRKLLDNAKEIVPGAWILHNKQVYSFHPLERRTPLAKICDVGAVEEHPSKDFDETADSDRRKLFVQLLNKALRFELGAMGIKFFADDFVHAFAGKPDEANRYVDYQNAKVRSTAGVVMHYTYESKDGRQFNYMRHLAFKARFRKWGSTWYLEINPTYRFTRDGFQKDYLHGRRLSGIKKKEKNRSVLSQVLLIADCLCRRPSVQGPVKLLKFEAAPTFEIRRVPYAAQVDDESDDAESEAEAAE